MPETTLEQPATQPQNQQSEFDQAVGELDSAISGIEQSTPGGEPVRPSIPSAPPEAKPAVAPAKEAVKPGSKETKPAAKVEPKTETKPGDKPPEVKPGEEKPVETGKPKTGWQRAHEAEKRVKELEGEITKLKTAPKPQVDDEFQKRYTDLETRFKALDGEMRYIDYERSSEFQEKHYAPYVDLVKRAEGSLREYRALNEDGTERPATAQDLWEVIQAGSQPEARRLAKKIFGEEDAQDIIDWRAKIRDANYSMQKAKDDFRQQGSVRQQQQMQELQQRQQKLAQAFNEHNAAGIAKYPQWFKAEEGDEEGATLLEKGFALADKAFTTNGEEAVELHSAMRNRAGAFNYLTKLVERKSARIEELEKALSQYEDNQPEGGKPPGGETAPQEPTLEQEIDKFTKQFA